MSRPAIQIEGFSKSYRTGFMKMRRFEAVRSLDLTVAEGEIIGIVGPNGAGKTTTLKALVGLLRPTAGTLTVLGQ